MEVIPEAIEDAQFNALNNKSKMFIMKSESRKVMKKWQEKGIKPSVIVVDPPRKGLDHHFY